MTMLRIIKLFFRPAGLDFAQMGGGIDAGLASQYNANRLPQYQGFVPGNAVRNDVVWNQAMEAIKAATDRNTGMVDPVLLQSYAGMLGIDLSGLVSSGAMAGQQYAGLGQQAGASAGATFDQAGREYAAGRDIYEMGRDPQNKLHDYMRQQTVEGARGADTARGIAMSPYSAGSENDATRKFEMNWQNQQLARAQQGQQGLNMGGYYGGVDLGRAMEFGGQQPGYTMASAQAPIAGQEMYYRMPMDWSTQFTNAEGANVLGQYAGVQGSINPYLGLASQAGANQSYYGLGRAQMQNQMQVQGMGMATTGYSTGMGYNQGSESGGGKPENWMGMGGGGGGGGGGGMGGGGGPG